MTNDKCSMLGAQWLRRIIEHCSSSAFYFSLLLSANGATYVPPVGIPAPPFGINETPVYPSPWTNTIAGAYYIDNLHPSATDTLNTNGYPAKPRKTIPNGDSVPYPAGAVVVVTNGPYGPSSSAFHLNFTNGTVASPIFFMGYGPFGTAGTKAWITNRECQVKGSYFVVDGFYFQGTSKRCRLRPITGQLPDHWSVRNNEFTDPGASTGNAITMTGTYGVCYNNYCHHNGNYQLNSSHDVHSALCGDKSHHVWFLDNDLGFCCGDSVQINSSQAFTDMASFVYIGRNKMHDNKENGVDLKTVHDVVFSENEIYNLPRLLALGGSGDPIAINDENDPLLGDHNLWVILNRIHDCQQSGIRHQSWCHSYGNLIYNIIAGTNNVSPAHAFTTFGMFQDSFENNTIVNNDNGIYGFGGAVGTRHEFRNNLMANVGTNDFTLRMENAGLTNSLFVNNLLTPLVMVNWTANYSSVAAFEAAQSAYASNNFSSQPGLVSTNSGSFDFSLSSGSSAIEAGTTPTAPALFFALYGIDIAVDINHSARPQGARWDIGAFEFNVTNLILSVSSTIASPGANITVSPIDTYGLSGGITSFARGYTNGTVVTVSTVATNFGYPFIKWQLDGVDYSFALSTNIVMTNSHALKAVFSAVSSLKIITINSSPTGVNMSVSPADSNGDSDGVTPFVRSYNVNTFIQIVPHNTLLNSFRTWLLDGVDLQPPDSSLLIQADADHTVTEVNVAPRTTIIGRFTEKGRITVK